MTREDTGVGRERKEVLEGGDELGHVATRQVCTAVAHMEEGVAGEKDFFFRPIEADTSRCMTWSIYDFKFMIYDFRF